jgi:4-hydroxy 2-oxovalerate aldolase
MGKLSLLDCTLRDGGYVNDWDFGATTIANIYSRLNASGVEYIELGFINKDYKFDLNRSIMPHTKYLKEVFSTKVEKNAKLLAMIIMGEAGIESVGPKEDTPVDGLRIVFKKKVINEAFEFAKQCREKGYDIFFQPASITDYSDEEMIDLVKKSNEFKPITFYMVDTYGLLNKQRMFHYADLIEKHLDKDIKIGYHSHNNFQLSYATAIEFIEKYNKHDIVVDCTLYGMGKTTGNLNTELIVDYVNKEKNGHYNNDQVLEAIDSEIMKIRQQYSWGYSINGFIAASNDCHPKYVSYLLDKKSLSIASINTILKKIDKDNLTTFNKSLIEKLFIKYQSVEVNDDDALKELTEVFKTRPLLVLATGASLNKEHELIQKFIKDNNPIVVSMNHNPERFKIDYCFINNSKRFAQMSLFINNDMKTKLITTSNIIGSSRKIEYIINYAKLLVEGDINIISDNATLMFFNLLKKCGINKVYVAGFDGFNSNDKDSYVDNYLSYNTNENIELQNQLIRESLSKFRKDLDVKLLTKSYYEDYND